MSRGGVAAHDGWPGTYLWMRGQATVMRGIVHNLASISIPDDAPQRQARPQRVFYLQPVVARTLTERLGVCEIPRGELPKPRPAIATAVVR